MLETILKIATIHGEIELKTYRLNEARKDRMHLDAAIVETEREIEVLQVEQSALLASLSPSPVASPSSPYTDTSTANPRHTLRVWANGKRELIDPAGDAILAYPWRSGAAIVARLHDALSKPMTRPQVEAWAAANKINVGTAVGYLPMLANLGIVASDGLTWRALTPS